MEKRPKSKMIYSVVKPKEKRDDTNQKINLTTQDFYTSIQISQGTCLKQRYCIQEKLGQGGMGRIYKASDLNSGQEVAIKQILIPLLEEDSSSIIERFRREYSFLSQINHPNIIKVFDFFQEGNQSFLVMELVPGISIKKLIEIKPKSISLSNQIVIANQLSRAIEILNMAGILHRDIKPDNIMVDLDKKNVKVLDLGLAKSLDDDLPGLTAKGDVIGTLEYLSPEQIDGFVSPRSDIFSLGITLYQFFLWLPASPFQGSNTIQTMKNILSKELPPLDTQIRRECTDCEKDAYRSISKIVAKAVEKKPEKRLESSGILAYELENIYFRLKKSSLYSQETEIQPNTNHTESIWNPASGVDKTLLERLQELSQKYGKEDIFQKPTRRTKRHTESCKKFGKDRKKKQIPIALSVTIGCLILTLLIFVLYLASWDNSPSNVVSSSKSQEMDKKTSTQNQKTQKPQNMDIKTVSLQNATDLKEAFKESQEQYDIKRMYETGFCLAEFYHEKRNFRQEVQILEGLPLSQENAQAKDDIRNRLNRAYLCIADECRQMKKSFEEMEALILISEHTEDTLRRRIQFAHKFEISTHTLYCLKRLSVLVPQDEKIMRLLRETEESMSKFSPHLPVFRCKMREVLQGIGYAYHAGWDMNDKEVVSRLHNSFEIAELYFPDCMPFFQSLQALIWIKEKKYLLAAKELSHIKTSGKLYYPALSLFFGKTVWPEFYFTQGLLALLQNDRVKASNLFQYIIQNYSNYPEPARAIWEKEARFYLELPKSQSLEDPLWMEQRISIHQKQLLQVLVIRLIVNNELEASKNIFQAVDNYEDFLCLGVLHDRHMLHYKAGFRLVQCGEFYRAEKHLEMAKIFSPEFYEVIYLLGEVYFNTGRPQNAQECFQCCVQNPPKWAPWMLQRSKDYLRILQKK